MLRLNNLLALTLLAGMLAGCYDRDLYLANSDKIGATAGDAIASNRVTEEIDPWPAASGNRNIGFNGQRMQAAVERYRNGQVYPPRGIGTSGSYQAPQGNSAQNTTPVGQTVTAAAPTK
ncbi:MAG TPA: hypothetical protein VFB45_11910 [Pseudolabrys sp.]|nr:hypothetical protein [Pseudolabrys sp.]